MNPSKTEYKKPHPISVSELQLPPSMPRMGNGFTRWVGRKLMAFTGWRVAGNIPDHPKLIIAAAPHTSNWDFVHTMILVLAVGVKFSYLMKQEAFIWPFKKMFLALGGIPVDRSRGDEMMDQMREWLEHNPTCWVGLTPEGTRTPVTKYKTGFLRIAQTVEAPILLVAWDYPAKTFYFIEPPELTGDVDTDARNIKAFYDRYFSRHD